MSWTPSLDLLAQLGHAGYGALIVFVFYVFFPRRVVARIFGKPWRWLCAVIGAAGVLVWALPKEFLWDTLVEKATQADNWKDLGFYVVGMSAALLALYLKGRLRRRRGQP